MSKINKITCCICGLKINGYANNAAPVKSGVCCNKCNIEHVLPSRLLLMKTKSA